MQFAFFNKNKYHLRFLTPKNVEIYDLRFQHKELCNFAAYNFLIKNITI